MALFNCHECGNEVSTTAKSCPKCGAKVVIPKPKPQLTLIHYFGIALIGLVGLSYLAGHIVSQTTAEKEASPDAIAATQREAEVVKKLIAKEEEKERKRIAGLTPAQKSAEAKAKAKAEAEKAKQAEQDKLFGNPPKKVGSEYSVVWQYLKENMGDPDSLKMESCTDVYRTDAGWLVGCSYRGKNSFGGTVKEFKWFTIRKDTVLLVSNESAYRK